MMEVGVYNHQINVKKSKRSKMAALISNRLTSEYAKIEDFILKRYYLIGRWKSNALVNTKTSVLKSFPLQVMCACNCSQYLLLKLTSVLLYCFAGVTAWEDRGHTAIRLLVYRHTTHRHTIVTQSAPVNICCSSSPACYPQSCLFKRANGWMIHFHGHTEKTQTWSDSAPTVLWLN